MSRDDGTEDLHPIVDELKEIGARIISVGIGADTTLSEMKKIASKNKTALHFGEYEAPKTLGKAIIQGNWNRFCCWMLKNVALRYCNLTLLTFSFCHNVSASVQIFPNFLICFTGEEGKDIFGEYFSYLRSSRV